MQKFVGTFYGEHDVVYGRVTVEADSMREALNIAEDMYDVGFGWCYRDWRVRREYEVVR